MVVRRKYEPGTGQIGRGVAETVGIDEARYRNLREGAGPVPPSAPVWQSPLYQAPTADYYASQRSGPIMGHMVDPYVNPVQATLNSIDQLTTGVLEGRKDAGIASPTDVEYLTGKGIYDPYQPGTKVNVPKLPEIARPDRRDLADRQAVRIEDRLLEATRSSSAAAGITAALQQQADLFRQQRENAIKQGLTATAAAYDDKLAEIDRRIAQINADSQNNEAVSSWLQQQYNRPFELAAAAAEAIDTAGAIAATEAAVANLTQAKLESDARLQSALQDIGFEGLAGEIGIEAAQNMVAENSFLNEQFGIIEAQGAYQQEMADFQRDLAIANADQIEAQFRGQEESRRLVASAKLRDALADEEYNRDKVEAAKAKALENTRNEIARQYGEGVMLPSEGDFVMLAVQSQWDMIAGDLPDDQMGAYFDLHAQIKGLGIDFTNSRDLSNALRQLSGHWEGSGDSKVFVPGEMGDGWDMEDVAILRQMDAIITGAYQEYASIQAYQGSSTDADNRDPNNIAEADHYFKTGEILGPYGERAATAMSVFNDIRARWPGLKMDSPSYLRPLETMEAAKAAGRAYNSDHHAGGAMDIYFTPGSQNTAQYQQVEAYLQTLKGAGIITYIPLGANKAHNDHIHVSFNLPYGGQKDFVDRTAGFNQISYGNEMMDEAVDASPGSYSSGVGVS